MRSLSTLRHFGAAETERQLIPTQKEICRSVQTIRATPQGKQDFFFFFQCKPLEL